ncbi:MAG: cation diffusion facilitator family transporter [Myxococcota bacterium]
MAGQGQSAVVKAIIGNGVITLAKSVTAVVSGSGALRAEAIHSLVDTLNQVFLYIGDRAAARTPSRRFQYGYGAEANFWGLLAAIGVLLFGGIQTIVHGVEAFGHPEVPTDPVWIFSVLGFAVVVELWVLVSVLRGLAKTRGDRSWGEHLRRQGPGTVTVILEDSAAVLGSVLAAIAIALSMATQDGRWDAGCQVVIGVMLAAVGFYLIVRNRASLLGEAIDPRTQRELHAFIEDFPSVDRVTALKTRQLTATSFRVKAELVFSGGEIAQRLMEGYALKAAAASERNDVARVLGNFADELFIEQAKAVDELEHQIRERFSGALYIDLEPHVRDI